MIRSLLLMPYALLRAWAYHRKRRDLFDSHPAPRGIQYYGCLFGSEHEIPGEYIEDGFGSRWCKYCHICGAELQIMRPGEVQCPNEPH